MSLFRQLTEKPWLPAEGPAEERYEDGVYDMPTAKLGLRVFLVVATVLFSVFIVAYADRMTLSDWRHLDEPWLLWPNTVLLALSSAAMHWAWTSARREQMDGVRHGLLAGGVFAIAFLAGQLLVWRQLIALGYYAETNPANAFFYLLTTLHGLHLLGGLVALGRTAGKLGRGVEMAQLRVSVELCSIYWHFLLLLWLVLFGLLLFT